MSWPIPKNATQACSFIGLVCYVSAFLPNLVEHTCNLHPIDAYHKGGREAWSELHQQAFDSIKRIMIGWDCLTMIDFNLMPAYKIYVTMDASDTCSGTILSFSPTWESACPVAFDSSTFKRAELNYLVHKKELLAVIRALKKWRSDLVSSPFFVFTDHKTLENSTTKRTYLIAKRDGWNFYLNTTPTSFMSRVNVTL